MFAFKATYALAAAGLAFTAPAAAEYERGGARASETGGLSFGNQGQGKGLGWFEHLRRHDLRPGHHGNGQSGNHGHGNGHGHGHGHGPGHPCDKDDRCNTSPG